MMMRAKCAEIWSLVGAPDCPIASMLHSFARSDQSHSHHYSPVPTCHIPHNTHSSFTHSLDLAVGPIPAVLPHNSVLVSKRSCFSHSIRRTNSNRVHAHKLTVCDSVFALS